MDLYNFLRVDPTNGETWTTAIIDQHIQGHLLFYKNEQYNDITLWDYFRQDFRNWTKEIFATGNNLVIRNLRDYLRAHGCFVAKEGAPIAQALADVISTEERHVWTPEEINHQIDTQRRFYSRWNPNEAHIPIDLTVRTQVPTILRRATETPQALGHPENPQNQEEAETTESPGHQIHATGNRGVSYPSYPRWVTPDPVANPQSHLANDPSSMPQGSNLQPETSPTNPIRVLTDLMKVYNSDDRKYGGELYDILDIKLQVFYDCCNKVGLHETQYHKAYSVMLKDRASMFYYDKLSGRNYSFRTMTDMTKLHFETEENRQFYMSEWRETTLLRVLESNPSKSKLECLQLLFDKLQKTQRGLAVVYQQEYSLRDQIISACRGVEECGLALYKPAATFEGVCAELRSAVGTAIRARESAQFLQRDDPLESQYDQNLTDRTYERRSGNYGNRRGFRSNRFSQPQRGNFQPFRGNSQSNFRGRNQGYPSYRNRQKKCFVCQKPGCWSTKHSVEERQQAYTKFRQQSQYLVNHEITPDYYQSFLSQYEGIEGLDNNENQEEVYQLLTEMEDNEEEDCDNYITELGEIDGTKTVTILNDQTTWHVVTKQDIFYGKGFRRKDSTSLTHDRYSSHTFWGIIPDTGASGVSTAGYPQFQALQKLDPTIQLNTESAGDHQIRFGEGLTISQGTIKVDTPVGPITFHVLPTKTPFLYCIQDMDRMGVKLDNLDNVLIQGDNIVPIIRKWGHPWMLRNEPERTLAWNHLTELELRQLHRRFGHPSVRRLTRILQRAGQGFETKAIKHLTKYCHQCQMHAKSPGRFKFTLRDDYEFNYSVIIDVLYLDGKPVLQVVDSTTAFQAARFLKDMSAKAAWDTLRMCWIDTYLGPPEHIVHDAGKNFSSTEFKYLAKTMTIEVKEVPVEAHNSVGKVERYHTPLRRAYGILRDELGAEVDKETILQMAVKSVNDSVGPDGIIPTLLVFGAYPRMSNSDPPAMSVIRRAEAIRLAMKELRKLHAERQVSEALATRNGPSTELTLNLPINSNVRVWREKDGWNGPFKLIQINGQTCTIQMPYGPTNFRSTSVRPYYTEDPSTTPQPRSEEKEETEEQVEQPELDERHLEDTTKHTTKRGRGRPPGSRNKPKDYSTEHRRSNRIQLREYHEDLEDLDDQFITAMEEDQGITMAFLTAKEQADVETSLNLRKSGIITIPGQPFEESQKQEIDGLMARGVFNFVQYDPKKYSGKRIFKSRFVNEIKGKATNTPYEKSRLVIQAYNDEGKENILTQSPTIQRASQRIILALAPSLLRNKELKFKVWLRDITQAYVQSTTLLQRLILAEIPQELQHNYPPNTIMVVLRPLYGIPEAGTHWWATYHKHHREKLSMVTSTYDPCLLITNTEDQEIFGIVGMQTDDTLMVTTEKFSTKEEEEVTKAKLIAKQKEQLTSNTPLMFNGCIISQTGDQIKLSQKGQGKKLKLIDFTKQSHTATKPINDATESEFQQQYMEQRARGAYIATICQPEAVYDLSVAAQHQNPTLDDVTNLNKRLDWQIKNLDRGISYIPIDLATAKLYVFVDGSFANNKDLSSQIGYEIILANETTEPEYFEIKGNLIHWSSTKSKRVTRSVLASEIYGMVAGVDMAISISTTIEMITKQLNLSTIPTIVCTDSYSLYECLVKLGTTKEKRLMIDIMALRQSYEKRELQEVRWINGQDNPADAMTKSSPNKALEKFIDANQIRIRVEGWVRRGDTTTN